MVTTAFVRAVSPLLAEAELTYLQRQPIDVERARQQHASYRELLRTLGLEVVALPAAPDLADGVFVEDVVVVVDGIAVLTRPGAVSRRPEVATAAATFAPRFDVRTIQAPGTLDGGDVLQVGERVYVGRSTRTNEAALKQLREVLTPLGRPVIAVDLSGVLHLKSAVTALPDGTLIGLPDCVDAAAFEAPVVTAPEPEGAHVLVVDDQVVISASAPGTAALLQDQGWTVHRVAIDEFEKAEAGVTCLSVLA